jgi:integrase
VGTANKDIRTLRRIFNLAIEPRGYLPKEANPFRKMKQRKISTKPIRYLSAKEFQALYRATDDFWWKVFLTVAYTSGARTGELLNLMWMDVDFEKDRIRIVRKDADGDLHDWEPKDHESRVVPIPSEVTQRLADLQLSSTEGCPYVFIPLWRWKHIRKAKKIGSWNEDQALLNNLHKRFQKIIRQAEVLKCTLHGLRRSCITNWARVFPIHVVQKLAEHSDIRTTRQYYLAVQENDLDIARKVQEEILKNNQTDPLL